MSSRRKCNVATESTKLQAQQHHSKYIQNVIAPTALCGQVITTVTHFGA